MYNSRKYTTRYNPYQAKQQRQQAAINWLPLCIFLVLAAAAVIIYVL